jgi:hypothetical protein
MSVLARPFFNVAVIKVPLPGLIAAFGELPQPMSATATSLVFPSQPYSRSPAAPPLLLWSPACAPELTAFMPQVSSGDSFVVEYACRRFGFAGVAIRSSTQDDEWPINEFIVYESNELRRCVRAMKDSPRWEFYTQGTALSRTKKRTWRGVCGTAFSARRCSVMWSSGVLPSATPTSGRAARKLPRSCVPRPCRPAGSPT